MKKTTLLTNLSVATLALLLVLSPASAFAKNGKDKDKDSRREAKVEAKAEIRAEAKSENKGSCLRAFGHLIASGWLKKNSSGANGSGSVDLSAHCKLPFGIAKKLNNDNNDDDDGNNNDGDDEEDTTAPVISNISSEANSTSAVIKFTTDEKASAKVFYGTTAGLNLESSATLRVSKSRMMKDHSIRLPGLTANTKYFVVIQVSDDDGNKAASAEFNLTTKATADTTGPSISNLVAVTGSSSIAVSFNTNEAATAKVFYDNSSPVNVSSSGTAFVEGSATAGTNHSVAVPNLSANTQYFLVVQAKDGSGNVSSAAEFGAKTAQ